MVRTPPQTTPFLSQFPLRQKLQNILDWLFITKGRDRLRVWERGEEGVLVHYVQ
jgi:hypothetical protein